MAAVALVAGGVALFAITVIAAIVGLLKGRRLCFFLGFLAFPFWWAGAVLPAVPGSRWARGDRSVLGAGGGRRA